jgi:hypothetical protein
MSRASDFRRGAERGYMYGIEIAPEKNAWLIPLLIRFG